MISVYDCHPYQHKKQEPEGSIHEGNSSDSPEGRHRENHLGVCARLCAGQGGAPTTLLDLDPQGSATHWGIRRQANGAGPPKVVPVTVRSLSAFIQERSENGDGAVVIDTPPHTQSGVLNAGVLADLVLIPTRPAIHDVLGIAATISLCRDNRIKAPVYVLVNQAAPQGRRNQDFVQRLKDYGIPVSPHLVVRRGRS